jgi:hypothetical protein
MGGIGFRRSRRRRSRGQSLVEFALVLPIFLLMLFGLVDLGRYVYLNSTLSQAAREGARLAAVEASWLGSTAARCDQPGGPVCPTDTAELRSHVLTAANRMMVGVHQLADPEIHLSCDATTPPSGEWTSPTNNCNAAAERASNSFVSVRVVTSYEPITPLIAQIFSSIESAASATMIIN